MFRLLLRWLPLAVLTLVAFWLRTHGLDRRPMHADEGNQALKTAELLERGHYVFDPRDHHGPTLYYAGSLVARLRGENTLAGLSEVSLRLIPALFGTAGVVLLAWCITASPRFPTSGLARWPALAAALFLAASPPAVYFSRYFIQETLLAALTLATFLGVRAWWQTGLTRWALLAGICAGLMQATKASAPLFLALGLIAVLFTRDGARPASLRPRRDGAFALLAAAGTAALLYSSFGTHPAGLRDALAVYGHAIARFGTESPPTGHEKSWWYYLRLFGWTREGGLLWHQAAFSALALTGFVMAWVRRDPFTRGVAIYATLVTASFSAFPYKTPWHAVHFVPAYATLAAYALANLARLRTGRLLAISVALITTATLLQQVWRCAILRPADWRNPYAYVHTSADVRKFRPLAEQAAASRPGEPIRVISEEYWPLPWYLRGLANVGFWTSPPDETDGALVITSQGQADAVRAKFRRPYRETFVGLRPGFVCVVFIPES